jgi:hypothetical protein
VTDHREYIARRLVDPRGEFTIWGKSILQAYSRVAKLSFVPVLGVSRGSDMLVLGARIFNQLSRETRGRTHLVMTARDLLRCKSVPRSLTYDLKSYGQLYSLIENNDEAAYAECRRRAERILRRVQAKVVVANSTLDPINRLWLQVARELRLKTVCVQHGVYSDAIPTYVLEEDIIDRYVAFDDGQAAILRKNIAAEKIVSLGVRDAFEWRPPACTPKICFVGEDWERYGLEKIKRLIIGRYIEVATFLKARGYSELYYKPHPSEEMLLNIASHSRLLKPADVDMPDVYVGFTSTLLKEMSCRGKLVIQIWEKETCADNYEMLGYCLSITNDDGMLDGLLSRLRERQDVPFVRSAKLDEVLV